MSWLQDLHRYALSRQSLVTSLKYWPQKIVIRQRSFPSFKASPPLFACGRNALLLPSLASNFAAGCFTLSNDAMDLPLPSKSESRAWRGRYSWWLHRNIGIYQSTTEVPNPAPHTSAPLVGTRTFYIGKNPSLEHTLNDTCSCRWLDWQRNHGCHEKCKVCPWNLRPRTVLPLSGGASRQWPVALRQWPVAPGTEHAKVIFDDCNSLFSPADCRWTFLLQLFDPSRPKLPLGRSGESLLKLGCGKTIEANKRQTRWLTRTYLDHGAARVSTVFWKQGFQVKGYI